MALKAFVILHIGLQHCFCQGLMGISGRGRDLSKSEADTANTAFYRARCGGVVLLPRLLKRWKQEDDKVKDCLDYRINSRSA